MNRDDRDTCCGAVGVRQITSVLVEDYSELENKPAINGVELTKNSTAKQLSILHNKQSDYGLNTLRNAAKENLYVPVIGDSDPSKVPVGEFVEESKVKVVNNLDGVDVSDGSLIFLRIGGNT